MDNVAYMKNEHYLTLKRNKIQIHAEIWMTLEDIILSEINQIQMTNIVIPLN